MSTTIWHFRSDRLTLVCTFVSIFRYYGLRSCKLHLPSACSEKSVALVYERTKSKRMTGVPASLVTYIGSCTKAVGYFHDDFFNQPILDPCIKIGMANPGVKRCENLSKGSRTTGSGTGSCRTLRCKGERTLTYSHGNSKVVPESQSLRRPAQIRAAGRQTRVQCHRVASADGKDRTREVSCHTDFLGPMTVDPADRGLPTFDRSTKLV